MGYELWAVGYALKGYGLLATHQLHSADGSGPQ